MLMMTATLFRALSVITESQLGKSEGNHLIKEINGNGNARPKVQQS